MFVVSINITIKTDFIRISDSLQNNVTLNPINDLNFLFSSTDLGILFFISL